MQNIKELKQTPLKEALLACKVMVKYVLIFGCIVNLLMLSTPLYSMQVLDRVLSSGNQNTLFMLSLVIILALALLALVQAARAFAMNKMGTWFENKLSHIIFSNSIRSAIESKAMANSQQLRDLQTIKTFLTSPGLIAMMDTPWAIIFIIVLFILHTSLGILAVLGGVILVLFGILADRSTKPLIEANNENFIKSMRQVDQATRNGEVIEVMGFQGNIIKSWQKLNNQVQTTQSLVTKRQALFMECTKFIRLIIQISVTALGAYLVITNTGFSSGGIIAASSLVGRALAPFEAAINSWKGYVTCRKSYDRLTKTLQKHNNVDSLMSLPEPEGKLDVENVFFAPPGMQKHIIKGVNFAIEPGDTLAIIGPSASGKTTLAKLIVGIYQPNIGAVRVDNASLKDWKRDELGPHIGYLPQDVELFGGTIKDNIARMDEEAKHEDIIVAAQLAGVHEMILQLPMGYDTQIGFDGSVLSGGQRQRIGLARAFYGNPKLIILDEPNASLDSKGEEALSTAIAIAKEQKITTIIISHRTPILNLADKILVMKDGMVASFGPKEQVMQQIAKMQQAEQLGTQSK